MKKLSAFTLVELLIVIVIIGILMSALLPRLSGAQDIARDTSRQVAVNQLYTAIMSYRSLHGKWPELGKVGDCVATRTYSGSDTTKYKTWDLLMNEGLLTEIPLDPNPEEEWHFTGDSKEGNTFTAGSGVNPVGGYVYCVINKNSSKKAGGYIVAKTETPAKSNWVGTGLFATGHAEFNDIYTCETIEKATDGKVVYPTSGNRNCKYVDNQDLFYLFKF